MHAVMKALQNVIQWALLLEKWKMQRMYFAVQTHKLRATDTPTNV